MYSHFHENNVAVNGGNNGVFVVRILKRILVVLTFLRLIETQNFYATYETKTKKDDECNGFVLKLLTL